MREIGESGEARERAGKRATQTYSQTYPLQIERRKGSQTYRSEVDQDRTKRAVERVIENKRSVG